MPHRQALTASGWEPAGQLHSIQGSSLLKDKLLPGIPAVWLSVWLSGWLSGWLSD